MQPVPMNHVESEFDRDLSSAIGRGTSSDVSVMVKVSSPEVHVCADTGSARSLTAELELALQWFCDLRVDLELYEGASLLLAEPRQRARLVRFVVEQARSFRESGHSELTLSWRDHPVLVAVESIRFVQPAVSTIASRADDSASLIK